MSAVCKDVLYRREAHPTEGFSQIPACLFTAVKSISERNRTAGVIKVTDYATVYAYAVPRSVYPRKTSAMKHAAWQEYCKRHTSWNICHAPAIVHCSVELIHICLRTAGGKALPFECRMQIMLYAMLIYASGQVDGRFYLMLCSMPMLLAPHLTTRTLCALTVYLHRRHYKAEITNLSLVYHLSI